MRGRVRELVIYFKFHEIGPGVSELWGGGRKSPFPIDLAHGLYNSRDSDKHDRQLL